jgi:hypothetical protein
MGKDALGRTNGGGFGAIESTDVFEQRCIEVVDDDVGEPDTKRLRGVDAPAGAKKLRRALAADARRDERCDLRRR